ncbi:MAG: PDZ domain-containing protein [Luteolibacter sp.]
MKPKFSWIVVLPLISPAFALEAPVDDAPPPPLLKKGAATSERAPRSIPSLSPESSQPAPRPLTPEAEEQKTAFLGLVTAEVPSLLSEHLRLNAAEGILVRALMPDGPASKSGVSVNDVLLKVSGKSIATPADLSSEIAKHKIGDTIQLDLIHKGQPITRDVVLGERPPQIAASATPGRSRYRFQGLPQAQEEQPLDEQESSAEDFTPDSIHPGMDQAIRRMQNRMERLLQNRDDESGSDISPDTSAASDTTSHSQATVRVMDHEGSIELKSSDGNREITTFDSTGNLTWKGPWTTPEDRAAAPKEIRERVSRLHLDTNFQGKSLRFNLNPVAPGQN